MLFIDITKINIIIVNKMKIYNKQNLKVFYKYSILTYFKCKSFAGGKISTNKINFTQFNKFFITVFLITSLDPYKIKWQVCLGQFTLHKWTPQFVQLTNKPDGIQFNQSTISIFNQLTRQPAKHQLQIDFWQLTLVNGLQTLS